MLYYSESDEPSIVQPSKMKMLWDGYSVLYSLHLQVNTVQYTVQYTVYSYKSSSFWIKLSVDGDIEGLYLQNVEESDWKNDTIVRETRARKVSNDIKQVWHEMK